MNKEKLKRLVTGYNDFSGVISIKEKENILLHEAFGYADRNHKVSNKLDTKIGIASGCKIFTSIAICQLIEEGKLSFDTKIKDCLDIKFSNFDDDITIEHLLTHSSGIIDYFDEETMEDYSDLWKDRPMYNMRELKDFLSMIQNNGMEFNPGEKFKYNNAGFIVLGLIVENITGIKFKEYIKKYIFSPLKMDDTGYFAFDKLPFNTAYGYMKDSDGKWRSNIYSLPIIGGADGGAYTTAKDLSKFWKGLSRYKLLSKSTTEKMLTPYINVSNNFYYGYGVWIIKENDGILKYYIMGQDPGISMISSVYPQSDIEVTILGNSELGTWDINREINDLIKLKK
ncbi:serine hydrolase domain-containing protein [Anaeromonas frigoriresistens]|uniref:serine hydrolase domain-containing protein n=1 Tax=Anaeromonas frigoriresistens TaxID=2683708 RepID=UPI001A9C4B99|nr:serine hydrolase [Anaeromonas frigoriresistens]